MGVALTFLSGLMVGIIVPMYFRIVDNKALKNSIDIYNAWNDGTEERKTLLAPMEKQINKEIKRRKTRMVLLVVLGVMLVFSFCSLMLFALTTFAYDLSHQAM